MGIKARIILSFLILLLFPAYSWEEEMSPPMQDSKVIVPIERPEKIKTEVPSLGTEEISLPEPEKSEAAVPFRPADGKVLQEVRSIRFERDPEGLERVIFVLKGRYRFKTFAIEGDMPRLVCDFFSARLERGIGNIIEPHGKFIRKIRIGIHGGLKPRVRVVMDLNTRESADYEIQPIFYNDVNILVIEVSPLDLPEGSP